MVRVSWLSGAIKAADKQKLCGLNICCWEKFLNEVFVTPEKESKKWFVIM
jgi:hypothetical protein